jgi:hypothetical protein
LLAVTLALALLGPSDTTPPTILPEHREELDVLPESERDIDQAKRLFEAGRRAAAARRWDESVRFFAEAYRYSESPGQLYALGRAHRALYFDAGRDPVQLRLALLRFRQYVERGPEGPNRERAQRYIAELEPYANVLEGFDEDVAATRLMIHTTIDGAMVSVDDAEFRPAPLSVDVTPGRHRVSVRAVGHHDARRTVDVPEGVTVPLEVPLDPIAARLAVRGPKGADVWIDGQRTSRLPWETSVELPAGTHQLAVARAGRAADIRELSLRRGEQRTIDVDLHRTPRRTVSLIAMGLGGGSLVAAATLTGLAFGSQRRAQDIRRERETMGVSEDRFVEGQRAWQQRDAFRSAAIATGVVGGVLLATGVILYLTDRPRIADRLHRPEPAR